MNNHIHIICARPPWPADNGSAVDIMNRMNAFHARGIKVHLHFFSRDPAVGAAPCSVNAICETVQGCTGETKKDSVAEKENHYDLHEILLKDNHPILCEGITAASMLPKAQTAQRTVILMLQGRTECGLHGSTQKPRDILHKVFALDDRYCLRKRLKSVPKNYKLICQSPSDFSYLEKSGFADVKWLPPFPAWQQVNAPVGVGNLCLYHGDLSAPENEKAALWLLCHVFNKVRVPFVIAGKNPSRRLQKVAALCRHTCLVSNPDEEELNDLIRKAHINILPAGGEKNNTRVRLKLLHALYEGRHCVVTPPMVEGTSLQETCHVGKTADSIASIVSQLYYVPFGDEEITLRKRILDADYNNAKNIEEIINYLK